MNLQTKKQRTANKGFAYYGQSIIQDRHYAINWGTYPDDWDEITTDSNR